MLVSCRHAERASQRTRPRPGGAGDRGPGAGDAPPEVDVGAVEGGAVTAVARPLVAVTGRE